METGYMIFQTILDNLAVPILIAVGGGIALIVNKYFEKITNSIAVKNEIAAIEKRTKIRKDILETLEPAVKAAVASNMDIAAKMKENKGKLTQEDVKELNNSAISLVMNTLPDSLTSEDGVLLEIIGGREQLECAIKVMIERYVYEYKIESKKNNIKTNKGIPYPMNTYVNKK